MPGDEAPPDPMAERLGDRSGTHNKAWQQLLDEMEEIAEARREDGWEVTTVMSAHTNTTSKDMTEDDLWGMKIIVPNNFADRFEAAYDEDEFTEFLVYGNVIGKFVYLVTELIDPDGERSILIASRYDAMLAGGMISNAEEEGVLYTHVTTIDGTVVGTFVHDDWGPLAPHIE